MKRLGRQAEVFLWRQRTVGTRYCLLRKNAVNVFHAAITIISIGNVVVVQLSFGKGFMHVPPAQHIHQMFLVF
jgi:hypothetical protein